MAYDEIANTVHEPSDAGGPVQIYCTECGDEANETGWASPDVVMQYWQKVGNSLVCGDPRCQVAAAGLDDEELDRLLDEGQQYEVLTEEQVASMPGPAAADTELDLSDLPEVQGRGA